MRRYYGTLYDLTKPHKHSIVERLKLIIEDSPLKKKFKPDSNNLWVLLHLCMRENRRVRNEPSVVELASDISP